MAKKKTNSQKKSKDIDSSINSDQQSFDFANFLKQQGIEFDFVDPESADLLPPVRAGAEVRQSMEQSALQEAQSLMYQAWEAPNKSQRLKLARKALEISPDCVDAYVLLAEENAPTAAEARAFYEQGVQAGERALGKRKFKEFTGYFWGVLETRPYMRARFGLADVLWELGEREEAARQMQDMLRLNPNDNQGVRDRLAALLLEMKDDRSLEKLLKQYKDDWSANWKYTRALVAYRKSGRSPAANKALKAALEQNQFVPAYLLGEKRFPKQLPPFISPGADSEAVYYAIDALTPWVETDGALAWLAEMAEPDRG